VRRSIEFTGKNEKLLQLGMPPCFSSTRRVKGLKKSEIRKGKRPAEKRSAWEPFGKKKSNILKTEEGEFYGQIPLGEKKKPCRFTPTKRSTFMPRVRWGAKLDLKKRKRKLQILGEEWTNPSPCHAKKENP